MAFAVDLPPVCNDQNIFGVWLDTEGDQVLKDKNFLGEIVAYQGTESGFENYHYQSASAHLHHGPALSVGNIKVFMYQGSDGLSLFYVFGRPGVGANSILWAITTTGNDEKDKVILSDDPGELKQTSSFSGTNVYDAHHTYDYHTDGGVIGPFDGKKFIIHVKEVRMGHPMSPGFYSQDGTQFSLASKGGGSTAAFMIAHTTKQHCDPIVVPDIPPVPLNTPVHSSLGPSPLIEQDAIDPRPKDPPTDITGTNKPIPKMPVFSEASKNTSELGPDENVYSLGGGISPQGATGGSKPAISASTGHIEAAVAAAASAQAEAAAPAASGGPPAQAEEYSVSEAAGVGGGSSPSAPAGSRAAMVEARPSREPVRVDRAPAAEIQPEKAVEPTVELQASLPQKQEFTGPEVFEAVKFQYRKRQEQFHFTGIDLGGP